MNNKEHENIWILTFEFEGVIKLGGLGEVPANQVKSLSDKFDFTVFMPSHGQVKRLKEQKKFIKLPFTSTGDLDLTSIGEPEIKDIYLLGFYKFNFEGYHVILINGENTFSERYLNDSSVYNPETFRIKQILYTLGIKAYITHILKESPAMVPSLVHSHDYHVVPSYIALKQALLKKQKDISSIFTLHLLTWPRYELKFVKACGIDETPITIRFKDGIQRLTIEDIYEVCNDTKKNGENRPPSMERIGAVVNDLVISVSKSYLNSTIIPKFGEDLIKFKTDYVWNGCDWDYHVIYQDVIESLGSEIRNVLDISENSKISRKQLKEYLLTYKIGNLGQSPLINSEIIIKTINEISQGNIFIRNGIITPFGEVGPLAISTGRITRQKGFETIFEALPKIINVIPNVKFLLLILPTEYSLSQIKEYAQYVKQYHHNLRIIFGIAPSIFHLAHISADVYCALSRWEPFGIIALEAMASKLPVLATKVGGLQETVVDIRDDLDAGTGMLIEADNLSDFSKSVISLLKAAECSEMNDENDQEKNNIIQEIPDPYIKKIISKDPSYYSKLRENCYKRVENNFRWEEVSKKLLKLYRSLL
ncbi:MAG: GDP-mannose-dependent alpha-(1-6)-phosphatidylinositol monomannoside mannosyltransferase [Promethearchaeota archaeon]|nr:MAG: GDP-mannose-dependent alpha-(1-6)-phosphatidylinositol monomannoside mannosyltransferase [Candidatus Lokiarchaeota archaeon]